MSLLDYSRMVVVALAPVVKHGPYGTHGADANSGHKSLDELHNHNHHTLTKDHGFSYLGRKHKTDGTGYTRTYHHPHKGTVLTHHATVKHDNGSVTHSLSVSHHHANSVLSKTVLAKGPHATEFGDGLNPYTMADELAHEIARVLGETGHQAELMQFQRQHLKLVDQIGQDETDRFKRSMWQKDRKILRAAKQTIGVAMWNLLHKKLPKVLDCLPEDSLERGYFKE